MYTRKFTHSRHYQIELDQHKQFEFLVCHLSFTTYTCTRFIEGLELAEKWCHLEDEVNDKLTIPDLQVHQDF